ncbi:hypothetical protein ABTN04_18660, partial [Acinetobacter baumannii]
FDYSDFLYTGETITEATITVVVINGKDANPVAMKVGNRTINADTGVVTQRIQGGLSGVRYGVKCLAELSGGRKETLVGLFDVASI